jgi:hypothetical protein
MKEVGKMYNQALIDKLLDLSRNHAGEIAELWHKGVITNPRTSSFCALNRDTLIHQAASLYKNLKQLFFADNPYSEMQNFLDSINFTEYTYQNKIPLAEAIYALILLRRHIWLHAETQAMLYNSPLEMYQALESVNRTILLFDYAIYFVIQRYEELSKKK